VEADIAGSQRKVLSSWVRPSRSSDGTDGIALRDGRTLSFRVHRAWSAPAGVYVEQWFLVDPQTREVLHESPAVERAVWGLQGLTELTDEVRVGIPLEPGSYQIVFALGGLMGGEREVEAYEPPAEEAA
jgi:hypothetical protein